MESLPALRRTLPRKAVTCLVFACLTFVACAFYSLTADSFDASMPYKPFEFESVDDHPQSRPFIDATHPDDPASTPKPGSDPPALHGPSFDKASTPSNRSQPYLTVHNAIKRDDRAKTRYIYVNVSTTSAPTSTGPSVADTCHVTMKDSKLILLWTPFFGTWDYFSGSSVRRCPRCRNCRVTSDRSKLLESDAVIFHARDMSVVDMPPARLPHQRWIFYCLESPPHSDFPGLAYTENMFNWTMSYRLDSDIRAAYGSFQKVRPPRKLDLQYIEWSWSNKTRSVAWLTSHCPTHGGRDAYVKELKRHIDVDIYGKCGTSICPRGQTERCLQEFAQKYKFFLAFENTLCKDYITEKFYRTLQFNIVPVVFGGANYSRFAPPGSFVEALSFKSPKHLAFFLAGVGKNFKHYSSYFKWRENYSVELSNRKECKLCSMLHRKDLRTSSYKSLRQWWVKDAQCRVWKPKR